MFKITKAVFIFGITLSVYFLLTQFVLAESLFESNADTRFMIAMHADQAGLQNKIPEPWHVVSIPGGPFKGANLFIVFIDPIVVQNAEGKPNPKGSICKVVFALSAKNAQTKEVATMVIGGFIGTPSAVPGPYKNFKFAPVKRDYTQKTLDSKPGIAEDTWVAGEANNALIELRVKYQLSLPFRNKSEQKVYSAKDPDFFRIYRIDSATEMLKSVPMNVDRIQDYSLRVTAPEMTSIFNGTEKVVAITAIPFYSRQVFLP